MNGRLRSTLTLGRWLGPWAGESTPKNTIRDEQWLDVGGRRMRVAVHRPRQEPKGVWLVTPGLHPAGPDDPRLDRFCRVLAASGFVAVAPYLPDFLSLVIAERAKDDLAVAFDFAEQFGEVGIFSISFGSLPASALAASERGDRARALVLFGGFCDFAATVRFALTGGDGVAHDPLNGPVVHLHLLPFYPAEIDREKIAKAWREMVVRTWGKNELKVGRAREPHALDIARVMGFEGAMRDVFLLGCGLAPGGEALLEEALSKLAGEYAWADPSVHLAHVRTRVYVVHGREDDVIPYTEAYKIKAIVGDRCEVHVTGMYGHTGSSLPSPRALASEIATLVRVLRILSGP